MFWRITSKGCTRVGRIWDLMVFIFFSLKQFLKPLGYCASPHQISLSTVLRWCRLFFANVFNGREKKCQQRTKFIDWSIGGNWLECHDDDPVVGADGAQPEDDPCDGQPGHEEQDSLLEQQVHVRTHPGRTDDLTRESRQTRFSGHFLRLFSGTSFSSNSNLVHFLTLGLKTLILN